MLFIEQHIKYHKIHEKIHSDDRTSFASIQNENTKCL